MFPKEPFFRKIDIDSNLNPDITSNLVNKEFYVFLLKFILSLITIISGIFLILKGITSESIIELSYKGSNLTLNKAYPGTTLVIFGVILMLFSRLNIRIK
jgi:hypothetical protein